MKLRSFNETRPKCLQIEGLKVWDVEIINYRTKTVLVKDGKELMQLPFEKVLILRKIILDGICPKVDPDVGVYEGMYFFDTDAEENRGVFHINEKGNACILFYPDSDDVNASEMIFDEDEIMGFIFDFKDEKEPDEELEDEQLSTLRIKLNQHCDGNYLEVFLDE